MTPGPAAGSIGRMKTPATLAIALAALLGAVACGPEVTISETDPPVVGRVTARVVSTFAADETEPGVPLPSGLQVFVSDGVGQPLADATVTAWPGGHDPQPMAHQGGGRYELDTLSGRLVPPEPEYFFEVESEFLDPPRVVLRVPHEHLTEKPEIGIPAPRSEHTTGEALTVQWYPVPGAACYDVGLREHELASWTWVEECVDTTTLALDGELMQQVSFIRVRARLTSGDETFETADFSSQSTSSSEVRIFLVDPEG